MDYAMVQDYIKKILVDVRIIREEARTIHRQKKVLTKALQESNKKNNVLY
jgi:hypothetical protein